MMYSQKSHTVELAVQPNQQGPCISSDRLVSREKQPVYKGKSVLYELPYSLQWKSLKNRSFLRALDLIEQSNILFRSLHSLNSTKIVMLQLRMAFTSSTRPFGTHILTWQKHCKSFKLRSRISILMDSHQAIAQNCLFLTRSQMQWIQCKKRKKLLKMTSVRTQRWKWMTWWMTDHSNKAGWTRQPIPIATGNRLVGMRSCFLFTLVLLWHPITTLLTWCWHHSLVYIVWMLIDNLPICPVMLQALHLCMCLADVDELTGPIIVGLFELKVLGAMFSFDSVDSASLGFHWGHHLFEANED